MNQAAFRRLRERDLDDARMRAMAAADLAAVELADRADGVFDLDMLPSYLDAVAKPRSMRASASWIGRALAT